MAYGFVMENPTVQGSVLCYVYMVDGQGTSPRAILGLVLLNSIVRQNVCSKTYGSIMYR